MTFQFVLTSQAQGDLAKLTPHLVTKIKDKLHYFLTAPKPMSFAKPLVNLPPATHRFRFGDIRIKFFRQGNIFYITGIDFRGQVYR